MAEFCPCLAKVLTVVIYVWTNHLADEATVNRILLPRLEDKMPDFGYTSIDPAWVCFPIGLALRYMQG